MSKVQDVLNSRRTVYKFTKQEVEQNKIDQALLAASNAPCHKHTHPWKFFIMKENIRQELIPTITKLAQEKSQKNNSKDLFLLFHELVWTSCDSTLIDNEIQNVLHNYIEYQYSSNICNYYEDLLSLEKEVYFIGGDIGATGGLSQNYTYKKNKNINFIGIGMGENGRNVLVFNQNKSNI